MSLFKVRIEIWIVAAGYPYCCMEAIHSISELWNMQPCGDDFDLIEDDHINKVDMLVDISIECV